MSAPAPALGGQRYWPMPVLVPADVVQCRSCGALVIDIAIHDRHHEHVDHHTHDGEA